MENEILYPENGHDRCQIQNATDSYILLAEEWKPESTVEWEIVSKEPMFTGKSVSGNLNLSKKLAIF